MKFEAALARLDRLTTVIGAAGCTCSGFGPALVIGRADEELSPPERCKVHGELPRMVVRVTPAAQKHPERPVRSGMCEMLPGGGVRVMLPEPECASEA